MKNTLGLFRCFCMGLGLVSLAACTVSPSPTALPTAPVPSLVPSAPPATATLPPPSATAAAKPTETPSSVTADQTIQIFLIAIDDNGRSGKLIGCGDSLVPVAVKIPHTTGVLKAALEALLGVKTPNYGESGLYNALYQSDLQLESVAINQQGAAQIRLRGTLKLGGECDNPRVEAQLTEIALQFSTVKAAVVYINGKPLKEVLSLK